MLKKKDGASRFSNFVRPPQLERDEKGSAMDTIRARAEASRLKTEKLRKLRLAQNAEFDGGQIGSTETATR